MGASLAVACVAVGLMLAPAGAHGEEQPSNGSIIAGVIQDVEGAPIPGAWFQLVVQADRAGGIPWKSADASGRFEIREAPNGPVKLRAVAGHHKLFEAAGRVIETRGGARNLVITLETGIEVRLKVDPYDSRAMGTENGARLVWKATPQAKLVEWRWAPIAADGSIRFVQLPDLPAFEVLGVAGVNRPFRQGGLAPGKEVRFIRPQSGLKISGRIVPAEYAAAERVVVAAHAYWGFPEIKGHVSADGTFEIGGLPEGEYLVIAELRPQRGDWVEKRANAGVADIVLDFSAPK